MVGRVKIIKGSPLENGLLIKLLNFLPLNMDKSKASDIQSVAHYKRL